MEMEPGADDAVSSPISPSPARSTRGSVPTRRSGATPRTRPRARRRTARRKPPRTRPHTRIPPPRPRVVANWRGAARRTRGAREGAARRRSKAEAAPGFAPGVATDGPPTKDRRRTSRGREERDSVHDVIVERREVSPARRQFQSRHRARFAALAADAEKRKGIDATTRVGRDGRVGRVSRVVRDAHLRDSPVPLRDSPVGELRRSRRLEPRERRRVSRVHRSSTRPRGTGGSHRSSGVGLVPAVVEGRLEGGRRAGRLARHRRRGARGGRFGGGPRAPPGPPEPTPRRVASGRHGGG